MKVNHLLEAEQKKKESGPSGFEKIRALGTKTFSNKKYDIDIKLSDVGFNKISSLNKRITAANYGRITSRNFTIENVKDEREAINQALAEYKTSAFLKYTTTSARGVEKEHTINLTAKDVDVSAVDISDTAPNQIRQQLYGKTDLSGARAIKKIVGTESITLGNIRQIADTGDKRTKIFTGILDEFIDNPGAKNFPVTIVDDTTVLTRQYGFEKTADIINDFAEVLAPVGLLTDNLNGNGQRLIVDFLGAKNVNDLAKNATMHFQPGRNFPLVDSYIEYRGRVVSISSKSNGGAAAKFKGFANSMNEIKSNPIALEKFNQLMTDTRIKNAYSVLEILMKDGDDTAVKQDKTVTISAGQRSMLDYIRDSEQMIALIKKSNNGTLKNIDFTKKDAELFKQFILDKNITKAGDWNDKNSAAFRSVIDKFSPGFKNLFIYYRAPSSEMGRAFTKGKYDTARDTWTTFKQGCAFHISAALNRDQVYSDLATWIFNHSAIIQVNFSTSPGVTGDAYTGNGYPSQPVKNKKPLIFYNMIATWPATGVDTVSFEWGASEDAVHNKLYTGGHDIAFPTKDRKLTDLFNQVDPVASSMIEKLDPSDPMYDEQVNQIIQRVAEKRRTQDKDIAKTPDQWADQGVFSSNTLRSAIGQGVSSSSKASFAITPFEATRIAASGYTDKEIEKKYSNELKVGDKFNDFIQSVRSERNKILQFVLFKDTDRRVADRYNKLVSNDLLGRDNPYKTVKFTEDQYDKVATQRQSYSNILDPNAANRTDTILIQGIRNFERIRKLQPARFAILVKEAGLIDPLVTTAQQSFSQAPKISKLDAEERLRTILRDPTTAQLFSNNIPREEHSHVYKELVDMIKLGADDAYIKNEIKNWKQNTLVNT